MSDYDDFKRSEGESDWMTEQYYTDLALEKEAERIDGLVKKGIEEYNKLHGGPTPEYYFHPVGDFWLISYENERIFVEDLKGMSFIARLLSKPGIRFKLEDLYFEFNPVPEGQKSKVEESYQASIDPETKYTVRKEIETLQEKQKKSTDESEINNFHEKIDELRSYLNGSLGLGGKARNLNTGLEKIRKSVWKIIDKSIDRIGDYLPHLGMHLKNSIKTGSELYYAPEKNIDWKL